MATNTIAELRTPYLVMIGDVKSPMYAKTGFGIVDWRRDRVAGQLRFPGCRVDLGVPNLSIAEAVQQGARSLVLGVAPVGGVIPDSWVDTLTEAAGAGLDIVSGLHARLARYPKIAAAAAAAGARLIDVRVPPSDIPVGTGRKRRGRRVLTVGTDCAVGKKYTALTLHAEMREAGIAATFRATGQTGIMIAGAGLPIDAVVADFLSGAAEMLSPDNDDAHWDVIEGQGSLFHPGYAAVTLGLLHGSQPDAFVVCHDASRTHMDEWEGYALPSINDVIEMTIEAGRLTNKAIRCVGVSVNTSGLAEAERTDCLDRIAKETGLPTTDPLTLGMQPILANICRQFPY